MLEVFIESINKKKYLSVDFVAKEEDFVISRKCMPKVKETVMETIEDIK